MDCAEIPVESVPSLIDGTLMAVNIRECVLCVTQYHAQHEVPVAISLPGDTPLNCYSKSSCEYTL